MQANIKQFNDYATTILSRLYNRFPAQTTLELSDLCHSNVDSSKTQFADHIMRWLEGEGYIRTNGCDLYTYDGCVLTAKGLSLLLSEVEGDATVITRIKNQQQSTLTNPPELLV